MFLLGSGGKHFEDELRNAGAKILEVEIKRFPDGEKYVRVMGNGDEATVVSSTFYPQDEKIVELLLLGDALREKGFEKLKLVVPYFAYSRQDRVTKDGEPISVRAVMRALGIYYEELYIFDTHNPETLRFFPGKAVNVSPARVIGEYFREKLGDGLVLAPDKGALERARAVAEVLGLEYSHFEKRRISPTEVEMHPVDVDVKGKNVLIVDDIISTGGTMVRAAELLRKLGAKKIYVSATHGVFAEGAIERVSRAVDELAVTNTIPTPVSRISIVPELLKLE
ncbi:phosphoribosylpyrophosphate synthetase [Thermococcus kodakarensis KOD1]|uniref:Ribose-phosphate pyrophosphokinase n=1 Tax=Thermococcus kodakarensis (strain ATCC BAA-918 / JCM 12380 / KOD1) TaxID=69014 RepID=KPRS_THEKO|nr:ribose-phosphate diphosphokinase [Thermococcus kodakarensis]O52958.1 RecName: Full=Ribose-phosphate pyrophosphokinase; Short=RPPK; AltName: Full=5-phospho-D-ribosyl alpha-1-diphosphate synthase; AltName: Full=Phosphoribosyl diphosphate synthase; AltName: Full=Phosphoribosyl pyrophosphate synthase; Short=P-Rib-PP synthase; Short=PRPP synthase; Short=PRPPase [Thermococcus kodakarensis KOD1]BAA24158.1 Pk-RPPK [Pyrococcus sp.]WCN28067.1 ribose-phosphate diphosphokinase [Thermococcus kodakarensis]